MREQLPVRADETALCSGQSTPSVHDLARGDDRAEIDRDRLLELSVDMVATAGADGRFVFVNPAWTTTLGWSAEELTSRPFLDFVVPEDRESLNEGELVEVISLRD